MKIVLLYLLLGFALFGTAQSTTILFAKADWCLYCSKMEQTTFTEEVQNKMDSLNIEFVTFKIDTKDTICVQDSCYTSLPIGVNEYRHSLIEVFLDNDSSLPALVFILPNGDKIIQRGYINEEDFLTILTSL